MLSRGGHAGLLRGDKGGAILVVYPAISSTQQKWSAEHPHTHSRSILMFDRRNRSKRRFPLSTRKALSLLMRVLQRYAYGL